MSVDKKSPFKNISTVISGSSTISEVESIKEVASVTKNQKYTYSDESFEDTADTISDIPVTSEEIISKEISENSKVARGGREPEAKTTEKVTKSKTRQTRSSTSSSSNSFNVRASSNNGKSGTDSRSSEFVAASVHSNQTSSSISNSESSVKSKQNDSNKTTVSDGCLSVETQGMETHRDRSGRKATRAARHDIRSLKHSGSVKPLVGNRVRPVNPSSGDSEDGRRGKSSLGRQVHRNG